jgi:hypothetical protein
MKKERFKKARAVGGKSVPMAGSSGLQEIMDNNRQATTR